MLPQEAIAYIQNLEVGNIAKFNSKLSAKEKYNNILYLLKGLCHSPERIESSINLIKRNCNNKDFLASILCNFLMVIKDSNQSIMFQVLERLNKYSLVNEKSVLGVFKANNLDKILDLTNYLDENNILNIKHLSWILEQDEFELGHCEKFDIFFLAVQTLHDLKILTAPNFEYVTDPTNAKALSTASHFICDDYTDEKEKLQKICEHPQPFSLAIAVDLYEKNEIKRVNLSTLFKVADCFVPHVIFLTSDFPYKDSLSEIESAALSDFSLHEKIDLLYGKLQCLKHQYQGQNEMEQHQMALMDSQLLEPNQALNDSRGSRLYPQRHTLFSQIICKEAECTTNETTKHLKI